VTACKAWPHLTNYGTSTRKQNGGPPKNSAGRRFCVDRLPSDWATDGIQLHTAAGRLGRATYVTTAVATATAMVMEQAAEQTAMAASRSAAGWLRSAAGGCDWRGTGRLGATNVATTAATAVATAVATATAMAIPPAEQTAVAAGRSAAGRLGRAARGFNRRGTGRFGAAHVATTVAACIATATAMAMKQAAEQAAMTRTTRITTAWLRRTARRFCAAVAAAKQVEGLRGVCAGDQPQAGQQGQRQHNPTLHGTYS